MNFAGKQTINIASFDDEQFYLNGRINPFFENTNNSSLIIILVELNGFYKKPNLLEHQLFVFQINEYGKLLTMEKEGTEYTAQLISIVEQP